MSRLIKQHEAPYKKGRKRRILIRVVASVLIIFAVSTIVMMSVEASRVYIYNLFSRESVGENDIEFTNDNIEIIDEFILHDIEGFEQEYVSQQDTHSMFRYINNKSEFIIIDTYKDDHFITLDNDEYKVLVFGEYEAYYIKDDMYSTIIIFTDKESYKITSNIEKNELIILIKNIF